jgi:hypothetical protein
LGWAAFSCNGQRNLRNGIFKQKKKPQTYFGLRLLLVTSGGFEPPAYRLGGGRSIQLSYEVKFKRHFPIIVDAGRFVNEQSFPSADCRREREENQLVRFTALSENIFCSVTGSAIPVAGSPFRYWKSFTACWVPSANSPLGLTNI